MLWRKFRLDWQYAFGEFAIVVLGVLAAFWVENWNSDRNDRVLEQRYMQSLLADLQSDIESYDYVMERSATHANEIKLVLSAVGQESVDVEPTEFARAVSLLSRLSFPVQSRETINDLMSTGNLRIIRSDEVRSGIAKYYSVVDMQRQWQPSWRTYQQEMGRLLPTLIDVEVRAAVEPLLVEETPDWWKSNKTVTSSDVNEILRRIAESTVVVPAIENMYRVQALNHGNSMGLKKRAEELFRMVEVYFQKL